MVRALKDADSNASDGTRLKIDSVLEQLAEAKLAGEEAFEEIKSSSAHAEMRDRELDYLKHFLPTAQLAAPVPAKAESSQLTPVCDAARAADLVRLVSFAAADQGFRSLDVFASWFVGGTAAAVGLMIANIEKIEPFVGELNLQAELVKVVIALGLVGVAKFFGSLVCTMARAAERALEVSDAWQKRGMPMPSYEAFEIAREAALPAPFRWIPKHLMRRSYAPAVQARQVMSFLMIAGLSTLTAVTLVIVVLVDVAIAL